MNLAHFFGACFALGDALEMLALDVAILTMFERHPSTWMH